LENELKIGIGLPSTGVMRVETAASLISIIATSKIYTQVMFTKGSVIPQSRNKLVKDSIREGFTHIFFIDTDMILPPDTLTRLLSHKKPIVAASFNFKKLPLSSVVKLMGKNGEIVGGELPSELFECYAIGTGCSLIDVSVFKEIDHPWFLFDYDKDGELITEDVFFCDKARAKGFSIWCDPSIKTGHIGDYVY
jgi:hypothetical protein